MKLDIWVLTCYMYISKGTYDRNQQPPRTPPGHCLRPSRTTFMCRTFLYGDVLIYSASVFQLCIRRVLNGFGLKFSFMNYTEVHLFLGKKKYNSESLLVKHSSRWLGFYFSSAKFIYDSQNMPTSTRANTVYKYSM